MEKSEFILIKSLGSNLRLKFICESNDKGRKSIQISSLKNTLNNTIYKNFSNFKKQYPESFEYGKNKVKNFKVFIFMDTDDCDKELVKLYKSGEMFSSHWLSDYIIPIYFDTNLEDIMKELGIIIEDRQKVKQYEKIFPKLTDGIEKVIELKEKLSDSRKTNLSIFLEYCIDKYNRKLF